jgi:uncharacterized protein (DUF1800 family)
MNRVTTVRFRWVLVALALLLGGAARAAPSPGTQYADIIHVLNRLGYGPRPGDVERVRQMGIDRYIEEQLHPERISDGDVEKRLAGFRTLAMTPVQLVLHYPPKAMVARLEKLAEGGNARAKQIYAMLPPADERGNPREILVELASQKLIRAVYSERQLQEVMVDFWMNHFNVYWPKGADRVLLTSYERDAIRPHVMGRFRDLLLTTAHSPAMLFYLDNWLSTSADAPHNPKAKRKPGLNENYARELMELHTLGVDGGYTQKDVVEVARCFTGWTIDQPQRAARFVFRPRMHDNGQKVVLGHVIPAGGGESDGLAVLDILARDPHTARFIATKLCRRFVADEPPKALVERVARVYLQTDGDVRQMLSAIFHSSEFASAAAHATKIKTPFELVVSSLRAVDADTVGGFPLAAALNRMGEPLYLCQPPTGYADKAEAWVSAGALLERLSFAVGLMEGKMTGTTPHPERAFGGLPQDRDRQIDLIASRLLGADLSPSTRQTLHKTIDQSKSNGRALEQQLVGLILGSPEFQRR